MGELAQKDAAHPIEHVAPTILEEPEREDYSPPTLGHIPHPSWPSVFSQTLISLLWFLLPDPVPYLFPLCLPDPSIMTSGILFRA